MFSVNCIEKTKIKKKSPGMARFLKKTYLISWKLLLYKNCKIKPSQQCLYVQYEMLASVS